MKILEREYWEEYGFYRIEVRTIMIMYLLGESMGRRDEDIF